MSLAKVVEAIVMPFGLLNQVGQGTILDGGKMKGKFWRAKGATPGHARR